MINSNVLSIAIGSFDGIHLAHRELISLVDEVVVIERGRGRLTPGYKRCYFSPKPCAFYLFEKVKDLSAKAFIDMLLRAYPKLQKIVVGYDFRFGKDRAGTPETIKELFTGEVVVIDEVTINNISIHSKTVVKMLRDGDIKNANRLLGREYSIDGVHIKGQGIGSKELVPTINLEVEDYILPLEGVYITQTTIRGVKYPSVTFLGHRKTLDGSFAIETHIIDRDIQVNDREKVEISFISFIRENLTFDSLDSLKSKIIQDISQARSYFDIISK